MSRKNPLIRKSPKGSAKPGKPLKSVSRDLRTTDRRGEHYYISGTILGEKGNRDERVHFFVPADVEVVGLYFSINWQRWILREETSDSREPTGKAWLEDFWPPENEIQFSDA